MGFKAEWIPVLCEVKELDHLRVKHHPHVFILELPFVVREVSDRSSKTVDFLVQTHHLRLLPLQLHGKVKDERGKHVVEYPQHVVDPTISSCVIDADP